MGEDSSNSLQYVPEIAVIDRAFDVFSSCAVSLLGVSRRGFFLMLNIALVTSSRWRFLFALL